MLPDADQDEIKLAFRRLARRYHPDRAPDPESMARMIEVNRAWELIGDPTARAAYDKANGIAPRRSESAGAAAPEKEPRPEGAVRGGSDPVRTASGATAPATGSGSADPAPRPGVETADPAGHAGPPPGRPSGTVLTFGRYARWSVGEIARVDPEYLEWLARMPIGWQYATEIRGVLEALRAESARTARRPAPRGRRGLFGR